MSTNYSKPELSDHDRDRDTAINTAVNSPSSTSQNASIKLEVANIDDNNNNNNSNNDNSDNEHRSPPVSIRQLFRFATSEDRLLMLLGAVCAVGVGAAQPLMVIVFGKVMDSFIAYDVFKRDGRTDLADASINDAIRTRCLMFGMIGLGTLALSFGLFASFSVAADRQCRRIRELYYQAILRQEMGWFDAVSSGELTTRISGDVNLINEGIAEKIGYIVQNLTQFVGGFVLAFVYSWRLSLVLMASLPLLALSGAIMSKMMSGDANSGQGAYAQAGAIATEVLASIKTVMAFGAQDRELQRYEGKIDVAYKSGVRKGLVSGAGLGFMMFVMFAAYALGFWYGAKLIVEYGVSVGDVTIVFFALIIASFSIGIAAPYFTALATARGAAAKVFELIDRTSAIDSLSEDGLRPSISGRIELRGIDFHYPTRPDVPILRNFSLRIEPGQSVALVGSSGSGKSTIVGLVERFYDPAAGEVLFDGVNAKDINVRHLRQQIGLVAQEPVLFGTTIFRNIVWGASSDDYEPTRDEVERAARLANAHDFIMQLPNGYDTRVGEKGSQLSGGQRQRISIARALVRNPKILCLDEATSALDTQSERVVQDALDAAAKNRTTIMIAHRLSTIKNADAIVVMHKGEIVQVGTHNELLADVDGMYAELVRAQQLRTAKSETSRDGEHEGEDGNEDDSDNEDEDAVDAAQDTNEEYEDKVSPITSITPLQHKTIQRILSTASGRYGATATAMMSAVSTVSADGSSAGSAAGSSAGSTDDGSATAATAKTTKSKRGFFGRKPNKSNKTGKMTGKTQVLSDGTVVSEEELSMRDEDDEVELEEELRKNAPNPIPRLLRMNAPEWLWIAAGTLASAVDGALMPVFSIVFNEMVTGLRIRTDTPDELRSYANKRALYFVIIAVVAFLASFGRTTCFAVSGEKLTRRIRHQSFQAMLRQEPGWFDRKRNGTGALNAKLSTEAASIQELTGTLAGRIVMIISSLVTGLAIAFANGWLMTLIVLATAPIIVLGAVLEMKSMAGLGAVRKKAYEKSAQEAAETITNMRTVAGLTRERTFIRIFAANNDAPYRYAIRSSLVSGLGYGVSQAAFFVVYAIAFLAGGKLIINETYSVQQMFQVMFAVVFAAQALGQTSQVSAGFAKAKVAAVDVFMLLDRTSRIDPTLPGGYPLGVDGNKIESNNKNAESNSGVLTQPSRVSGRDVRFAYPSRPMVPILRGVDFDVLAGKTVALVGPSGCGKSTIIGLVQRLYDADGGRVSVHGVDVRRWNLQQLRATYAIVGQEPVLFDYTVGENISYGLPGATHAQIEQAARDANIHDFIVSLPDGYSTRVGEAGSQLSGGQKQRIAIARAIIRNPRLLLLDEATSALDSTSERVVQEALDRAAAGRTTIAIAHRLATVQNADCILVFSNGQIVESGTHRELLALKGLYHSLVQKQSLEVTH